MSNKFTGRHLEFHILQSFPVSCLNRDDMGSPKSAMIGGVPRARVSSQCWKRAIRLQMHELGCPIAKRTKMIVKTIQGKCQELGASPEQAAACGNWTANAFTKKVDEKGISDTLFFISDSEARKIAEAFVEKQFQEISSKELHKICKDAVDPAHDGLDIALFGRMVANAADMNVEAAAAVAHAISIHRVDSDIDFFTAVDDCKQDDESGSAHMGNLEFNSATYYRYISLDLGQLAETMKTEDIAPAVEVFTKALFLAVPSARQATMTAATPWDYAIIALRKGQRLQLPFNSQVKTTRECSDLVKAGISEMKKRFDLYKNLYGSLFGLEYEIEFGEGKNGFDAVLSGILGAIQA